VASARAVESTLVVLICVDLRHQLAWWKRLDRLDDALDAIIASRAAHHQARASYKTELAAVETQLAAKEEVVDRYLTEYEDNKIDREIVARRIEKISEQIRQLRHRRDELTFLTDVDEEDPTAAHLIEIRDQIAEIIATGTVQERKSMCEAMLAETTHRRRRGHAGHSHPDQPR
jgi:chromosome segregation ATPase